MKIKQIIGAALSFTFVVVLASCESGAELEEATVPETRSGSMELTVNNMVGNSQLVIGDEYQNANQDTFSVEQLQYLLSNVVLVKENGDLVKIPSSYHLFTKTNTVDVDHKTITNIPEGTYKGVRLAVGVDSVNNGFNDGEGDLSAANGVLWDWNTGYKFLVVDGNYRKQGQQDGMILHIGTDHNYRTLYYNFAAHDMQNLVIADGKTAELVFDFDLQELFSSVNRINLQIDHHSTGGTTATRLADNYGNNTLKLKQVIN